MPESVDLLIEGTVITMDPGRRVIRDGAVAVRGDRIVAVDAADGVRARYEPERTLGGARRIVLPGLIDCHNHLAQALVREYALEDYPNIYRVYIPCEMAMDEHDADVSARFGISQLLRAGVTTVAETTCTAEHEEPIARAVMETGIRCAMARGLGDRTSDSPPTTTRSTTAPAFRTMRAHSARIWRRPRSGLHGGPWRARGACGVRSTTSVLPPARTSASSPRRRWPGGTTRGDVPHQPRPGGDRAVFSLFGERPIEHLHAIGALDDRFLAIHAMLTTDREIQMLAEAGAAVAHAPLVCTDIVSAVTKVVAMRAAGVTVGLGCDTVINDLFKVMRTTFVMHGQATGIPLYDPLSPSRPRTR